MKRTQLIKLKLRKLNTRGKTQGLSSCETIFSLQLEALRSCGLLMLPSDRYSTLRFSFCTPNEMGSLGSKWPRESDHFLALGYHTDNASCWSFTRTCLSCCSAATDSDVVITSGNPYCSTQPTCDISQFEERSYTWSRDDSSTAVASVAAMQSYISHGRRHVGDCEYFGTFDILINGFTRIQTLFKSFLAVWTGWATFLHFVT